MMEGKFLCSGDSLGLADLRIPEFLRAKPLKFDLLHHKMFFFALQGYLPDYESMLCVRVYNVL